MKFGLFNEQGLRISHLPHQLPNRMLALRFDPPSRAWPSGKVVLSNRVENFTAAPPAVGLQVRPLDA